MQRCVQILVVVLGRCAAPMDVVMFARMLSIQVNVVYQISHLGI